jgi:predicted SAM-dependent methyltransferase
MKYLNLGCGSHFSVSKEWTNLDFSSSNEAVIGYNLLKGIPFEDESFNFIYHSHVLEHFNKEDGFNLLKECYRVLTINGTLRIAIPDLEMIIRNYLKYLELGLKDPENDLIRSNYNWMMIELYDQVVRNYSGGEMGKYLFQPVIDNEDFVYERIGKEGKDIRSSFLKSSKTIKNEEKLVVKQKSNFFNSIKHKIKTKLIFLLLKDTFQKNETFEFEKIGKFRLGGEIHQWMYDRYSLEYILKQIGFENFQIKSAFDSNIENWSTYNLDGEDGIVRKPDSVFIEVNKK